MQMRSENERFLSIWTAKFGAPRPQGLSARLMPRAISGQYATPFRNDYHQGQRGLNAAQGILPGPNQPIFHKELQGENFRSLSPYTPGPGHADLPRPLFRPSLQVSDRASLVQQNPTGSSSSGLTASKSNTLQPTRVSYTVLAVYELRANVHFRVAGSHRQGSHQHGTTKT